MAVESDDVELGADAPDFDLPATDGDRYSLESFSEADVLVVMFICNHCPYVKAVRDRLIELGEDYADEPVAFVAINPNDAEEYPDDSFERMKEVADEYDYPFPYLRDESQEVAEAYGAVCTPDIFAYDADRKLRYRGRIDDNWKDPSEVTREDLRNAIEMLLDGESPDPDDQHPSMGCSIKWK
ncbi:MAG: thioredoxin family protein [Bradymonadaceae bacterium]